MSGTRQKAFSGGWAALFATLLALAVPDEGHAQPRWTLDVRGGAAIPTAQVRGYDLGTGVGFRATLGYRILVRTAAYVDWDWHSFAPDESFAGPEVDFEESGYSFGIGFRHPLLGDAGNGAALAVRAGGTYSHIELEDSEGNLIADSGHGMGWEAGVGLDLDVTERVRVTPGLRYRSLSRPVLVGSTSSDVALRYLSLDFGVTLGF
jgi:hypothetical protein